ncbi:hypothetical protein YC2023_046355 [Brassica napus]
MITSTHDYQVEQRSCSLAGLLTSPHFPTFYSSGVSVGSEIYFPDHGWPFPSKKVRVLDTRSGEEKVQCNSRFSGSLEDKVYMVDLEHGRISAYSEEKVQCKSRFSASLEDRVYMVDSLHGRISAYTPREGISNVATESQSDKMNCLCVVENVIYACFKRSGLMWFDTKLKVWRRLVDSDGKFNTDHALMKMDIRCRMIALDRVGDEIRGKIEWSGIMATFPCGEITLRHCLVVSAD